MNKGKRAMLAPCIAIACAVVGCFGLCSWLNTAAERINANSECLSTAIEFEKDKTELLQIIAEGHIAYDDAVKSLLNTKYEIPSDADIETSRTIRTHIEQSRADIKKIIDQAEAIADE